MVSWGWHAEDDCEGGDEEAGDGAGEGGGGGVFGELSAEWVGQLRYYVRALKNNVWTAVHALNGVFCNSGREPWEY